MGHHRRAWSALVAAPVLFSLSQLLLPVPGGAATSQVGGVTLEASGGLPVLTGWPYPGTDIWRGVAIHSDANGVPDGGWEMDRRGRVVAFGAAPALTTGLPTAPIQQKLHVVGAGGYAVATWGIVQTF